MELKSRMWGWAQITKSETSSEGKQDATVLGEVKDLEFGIHGNLLFTYGDGIKWWRLRLRLRGDLGNWGKNQSVIEKEMGR